MLVIVAVHESPIGPSRHFACAQQSGRFWREADISWQAKPADLVANDPKLPFRGTGLDTLFHLDDHVRRRGFRVLSWTSEIGCGALASNSMR
jgi:hypothetical protein